MARSQIVPDYWWQRLRLADHELPPNVTQRLIWYEKQVPRQRMGFYRLDVLVIGISASIPGATSLGASAAVGGVLGAAVTAMVALRQLWRPRENWIRFGATRSLIQADVVAWSSGVEPYHT